MSRVDGLVSHILMANDDPDNPDDCEFFFNYYFKQLCCYFVFVYFKLLITIEQVSLLCILPLSACSFFIIYYKFNIQTSLNPSIIHPRSLLSVNTAVFLFCFCFVLLLLLFLTNWSVSLGRYSNDQVGRKRLSSYGHAASMWNIALTTMLVSTAAPEADMLGKGACCDKPCECSVLHRNASDSYFTTSVVEQWNFEIIIPDI